MLQQWQNLDRKSSAIVIAMNVVQCYKILGLNAGATLEEVKASYRSLARQFHPDVNPDARAHDKFIELHQAYQFLLTVAKPAAEMPQPSPTPAPTPSPVSTSGRSAKTHVTPKDPFFRNNPRLTDVEELLKQRGYLQLQQLLKDKRFPRAVALVEALAQRIAHDREIQQWLAIAYQRWGRHAIAQGELEKARLYLKKALRTDPHNRSLWVEVERDFRRMEQIFR